jgi:hypothetical protein
VRENEADWWDVWGQDKTVELQVQTEKERGLWAQLSLEDKKKLCEAIGYVEGSTRPEKPKQYIGEKLLPLPLFVKYIDILKFNRPNLRFITSLNITFM